MELTLSGQRGQVPLPCEPEPRWRRRRRQAKSRHGWAGRLAKGPSDAPEPSAQGERKSIVYWTPKLLQRR